MTSDQVILYIADSEISAHEWQGNRIVAHNIFDRDGMGIIDYGKFLENHKEIPFYLIINSVEEEYKLETMPHAAKRQSALLQRNLIRHYRENKFRFGELQGRQNYGKKEDNILLAAITDDSFLTTWIQPLIDRKISISCIRSLPLSTENVTLALHSKCKKLLVVTYDKNSIRLTFLDDNKFKISRLAKIHQSDISSIIMLIHEEIEKTLRYLGRLRLLFADQKPDIFFIGNDEITQSISSQSTAENLKIGNWCFYNSQQIREKLSLDSHSIRDEHVVIDMFIYVIIRSKNKNHYADTHHTKYYRSRQLRKPIEMVSGFFLIILAVMSAVMFIDSQVLDEELKHSQHQVKIIRSKMIASQEQLPDFPVSADAVRMGVNAVEILLEKKPDIETALVNLSKVLSSFKNIELEHLYWSVQQRNIDVDESEEKAEVVFDDPTQMADVDVNSETRKKWVQVIKIDGILKNFDGNYTLANRSIDVLVESLQKFKKFQSVIATRKPVSHFKNEKINGIAGEQSKNENAEFSLEIVTNDSDFT